MRAAAVASAILLLAAASAASAATIHVPADQPTIQAGIDAAVGGDTVVIACGTYLEHGLTVTQGIIIVSESGDPDCVTIDGEALGTLLTCDAPTPPHLEGITFTRGTDTAVKVFGGGISFLRCRWTANTGTTGGGIRAHGPMTAIECHFEENTATVRGGASSGRGNFQSCVFLSNDAPEGGALDSSWDFEVHDSTFEGNTATNWGGAISARDALIEGCDFTGNLASIGGAVDLAGGISVIGCSFSANEASSRGGAMWVSADAYHVAVEECTFVGNRAPDGGALAMPTTYYYSIVVVDCDFLTNEATRGGAIWATDTMAIGRCLFAGNWADADGGAIWMQGGDLSLDFTTLAYNGAGNEAGGIWFDGTAYRLALRRTVIAHSNGRAVFRSGIGPSPVINCTNLFGNSGGDWENLPAYDSAFDNFSADPLFCDPDNGDFTLSSQSPCLPGNHPDGADCGLIGAFGQGCGPVSVEQETWAGIKSRYRTKTGGGP